MTSRYTKNIVLPILHQFREMQQTRNIDSLLAELLSTPQGRAAPTLRGSVDLARAGNLLSEERKAQGKSLADIQQATNIAQSRLSQLESMTNANPTIETLIRIAAALGKKLMVALVDADEQDAQNEEPETKKNYATTDALIRRTQTTRSKE